MFLVLTWILFSAQDVMAGTMRHLTTHWLKIKTNILADVLKSMANIHQNIGLDLQPVCSHLSHCPCHHVLDWKQYPIRANTIYNCKIQPKSRSQVTLIVMSFMISFFRGYFSSEKKTILTEWGKNLTKFVELISFVGKYRWQKLLSNVVVKCCWQNQCLSCRTHRHHLTVANGK